MCYALKALIALGWQIEYNESGFSSGFAPNQQQGGMANEGAYNKGFNRISLYKMVFYQVAILTTTTQVLLT